MSVLSIDLAHSSYSNVGIAALDFQQGAICCEFSVCELQGPPSAVEFAEYSHALAGRVGALALLLDGPQGWKHPKNGLEHSRVCERELNTPAKTGLPGTVKPANYSPFVKFSIEVYQELTRKGWNLFGHDTEQLHQRTVIELFPLSAWRSLRIASLPSKRKATQRDISQRLAELQRQFRLKIPRNPSHDELQALVTGLAGIAFELRFEHCLQTNGCRPEILDGTWREGFIVNPRPATEWPEDMRS